MMTVFGAAEPIPIGRQFIGPVVTIDRTDLAFCLCCCWTRDVLLLLVVKADGWNASVEPAVKRMVALDSFIIEILLFVYRFTVSLFSSFFDK